MIPRLALLSLLALAACGKPAEPRPTAPVAAATEATLPADAVAAQPAYTVSETGLGPINADTAYDRAALAKLFPEARVEPGIDDWEGQEYGVLDVRGDDGLDLRITQNKGRAQKAWARGGPVVGPRGERIGDAWSKGGFKAADCAAGGENETGKIFCRRAGQPRVAYVYETGDLWEKGVSDNEVPSDGFLKANGVMTGLIWNRD
ncbi:MAG: hypothetical protein JWR84_1505 [Caulobacter sp.]|nr:hypothetical protein [Caulobacter sp.]